MANARALDKRRKSIRNIRKITRTMELIATAKFKRAMDRASASTAYTQQITKIVSDLSRAGLEVSHPLLEQRKDTESATLLMLTANRGLCGGYNSSVIRPGISRLRELQAELPKVRLEVAGKRGFSACRFRKIPMSEIYLQFDDQPRYDEVEKIANSYLDAYLIGEIDRLEVVYTRFVSSSKQEAVIETLLPLGSLVEETDDRSPVEEDIRQPNGPRYDFLPSAESILEEVVPMSFKVRLFKCFLDAAVSEQIARMVAMKAATDNASDIINRLSMTYNRARQSQITTEIMDIIGGVEALAD